MAVKYVAADTTSLYEAPAGMATLLDLLWGDHVEVVDDSGPRVKVRARGKLGYVNSEAIGDQSLLELYCIDVGQGDGVLIRTPDNRHVLIDGGYTRASQPTGKSAADFVDWKFAKDYGVDIIHLDAMIASHNDADHYGGLNDLLDTAQEQELDAEDVRVDAFYHAGVAWWVNPATGKRWLGPPSADGRFLTQLLGERPQVLAALEEDGEPRLQGEWAAFLRKVTTARGGDGQHTPIARLSERDGCVPGFDGAGGHVALRVLAPVDRQADGRPAVRRFSSDSKNTNGNSLLFRLDYGRVRILLTGDLNADSQQALLNDYNGRRIEFQCDVAKACHHGSDDVSYEFLSAVRPAVTIISSGDAEGHDHPRPAVVAASATTGYLALEADRIVSPLVYSTELARSINLGKPEKVTVTQNGQTSEITDLRSVVVDAAVTKAGDLRPTRVRRSLDQTFIVAGLIYGLVNVRTDGETILCATLNEKSNTWQVRKVRSRF